MKLKESVKGFIGVCMFYTIIFLGIVLINARLGEIQNKSADTEVSTQYTNVNQ